MIPPKFSLLSALPRMGFNTHPTWARRVLAVSTGPHREFSIDLQALHFIQPSGIIALAHGVGYLKLRGFTLRDMIHPRDAGVDRYLNRFGLYDYLGQGTPKDFQAHPEAGRFVVLREIRDKEQCVPVSNHVIQVLMQHLELDTDAKKSLEFMLPELTENIFNHAFSPFGGLICAQAYREEIEVAIGDLGVGIAHGLRDSPEMTAKVEKFGGPLKASLQRGVTSRPALNAGMGLFWASQLTTENEGVLAIYSQFAALRQTGKAAPREHQESRWPGTLITLRFNRKKPLNVVDLFNRLAPESNDYNFLDSQSREFGIL
jgi:anti-sigma regulatory factor (Ser/Thr protein kinase)